MFADGGFAQVKLQIMQCHLLSLPKLDVIALGRGLHFVQEDHPHAIGEHHAAWVRRTRAG